MQSGSPEPRTKLLFVDDEPNIRATLSAILDMHDFEVDTAATVPEALAAIQKENYDVLLSDLNIGEPGDGFTVVSAMRRMQPSAITIIITGYPAFETALEAIRNQVDDYIVKPADPARLVSVIRGKLSGSRPSIPPPLRKLSFVLEDNIDQITDRFIAAMSLGSFPVEELSRDETSNALPKMLRRLVLHLRQSEPDISREMLKAAVEHGKTRCAQKFELPMLVLEMSLLRSILYSTVQDNLLIVDISTVIPDILRSSHFLDQQLAESVKVFIEERGIVMPKTA